MSLDDPNDIIDIFQTDTTTGLPSNLGWSIFGDPTQFAVPGNGTTLGYDASGNIGYYGYSNGQILAPTVRQPGGGNLSPLTSSYPGPTLGQMLLGVGVLSGITLLLPPKYALLLPIAVLLGYTATHQQTFQTLFAYLTNLLQGVQNVAAKI